MTQAMDPRALLVAPSDVALAGGLLLREVEAVCDPSAPFPIQVEASLRIAFDLVSTRTDVLCLLPDSESTEAVTARRIEWQKILAAKIRTAAERRAGPVAHPPWVEYLIIGGIQSQVRRWLNQGRPAPFADQIPGTVEFVCVYYPAASEPRRAVSDSPA